MIKRKILALALAGALACPQVAFAARDGEGMEYTSAAEGFYGSLRTRFNSSGGKKDQNAKIEGSTSRLGVRGTLDVGHGLTGLYRYEFGVDADNDGDIKTRLHYVGLKGSFGEVQAGAIWGNGYNWVTSATDGATSGSGNFAPRFRSNNSLQYTTPNLNGFQGSFRVAMNGGAENDKAGDSARAAHCAYTAENGTVIRTDGAQAPGANADVNAPTAQGAAPGSCTPVGATAVAIADADPGTGGNQAATLAANTAGTVVPFRAQSDATRGSENVDEWALHAKYGVRGFTVAGMYEVHPGAAAKTGTGKAASGVDNTVASLGSAEDVSFWALRGGYGQDNWAVNAWYGVRNDSDWTDNTATSGDDTKIFSVSGNISIGKVALVVVHENKDHGSEADKGDDNPMARKGATDTATILNVDYNFTSKSRVWASYVAKDFDSAPDADDEIHIGLRMDF